MGEKEFLNLVTVLTLHIDPQNWKITIIGSQIKIMADLSSDLMGHKLAQPGIPVWREIQKTTSLVLILKF